MANTYILGQLQVLVKHLLEHWKFAAVIIRAMQDAYENVLWLQWPHVLGHLAYFWLLFDFLAVIISPILLSKPFQFRWWMIRPLSFIGWEVKDQLSVSHIFPWMYPREGDGKSQEAFLAVVSHLHLDSSEERWILEAFRNVSGCYCSHYIWFKQTGRGNPGPWLLFVRVISDLGTGLRVVTEMQMELTSTVELASVPASVVGNALSPIGFQVYFTIYLGPNVSRQIAV